LYPSKDKVRSMKSIRTKPWTFDEDVTLMRLAASGGTADQIAKRLRREASGVRSRAKALAFVLERQARHVAKLRNSLRQPDGRLG
jgi:hypothetical protein